MKQWIKLTATVALACTFSSAPLLVQAKGQPQVKISTSKRGSSLQGAIQIATQHHKTIHFKFCDITLRELPDYSTLSNGFVMDDAFNKLSPKEKGTVYNKWAYSPVGKKYLAAARALADNCRVVDIVPNSKGQFTIPNLKSGTCNLFIRYYASSKGVKIDKLIAQKSEKVSIPSSNARVTKTFILQQVIDHAVGEMAPNFAIKTIYGKKISLKDYRGKFVLIDFWAVWCAPCRAELPNVQAAYEQFGGKNFHVLGLSLDNDTQTPIKYVKKHKLTYTQGFLGPWKNDNVTKLYGIRGIPSIWLIGPNGKIVAKNLYGQKLHRAVKKALAQVKK